MRAYAMTEPRPGGANLVDLPEATMGPLDIRVEVRAVGVCGTDIGVLDWASGLAARTPKLPLVMGHEGAAVVTEVGSELLDIRTGDVVAPISVHWCGECGYCRSGQSANCKTRGTLGIERDGVLAGQVVVHAARTSVLPSSVPPEIAALSDPPATVLQAMARVPIEPDSTVAVVGSGTIGLMTALVARTFRPKRVVLIGLTVDHERLRRADELGIETVEADDATVVTSAIDSITDGEGVDVAFETAGHPNALQTCLQILRRGGRLGLIGLSHDPTPLNTESVVWAEQTLIGVRGYSTEAWAAAQRLIIQGQMDLSPLITHHLEPSEVPRAMELVRSREALKVIIHPTH